MRNDIGLAAPRQNVMFGERESTALRQKLMFGKSPRGSECVLHPYLIVCVQWWVQGILMRTEHCS